MNAYKEILSTTISLSDYQSLLRNGSSFDEYTIEELTKHNWSAVELTPKIDSKRTKEWISSVLWAEIERGSKHLILRSKRTKEDEIDFLTELQTIEYDNGYGGQELFGRVVFNDSTWMERGEYDGSEWWDYKSVPQEPEWDNH